ncbi:hypothetical protein HQ590_13745, partial [bacterium]|nr:hypothetical protein [bacterium]
MRGPSKILAVFVLACLLGAGSTALAQTSNFWTNAVGTVQWSTAGNWDPNTVPTTTNTFVLFTNAASSAYTVQFSGVSTSGPLIVTSDNVTFDVAGYTWRAGGVGYDYGPWSNSSHLIAWDLPAPTGALTATVVFSSSSVTNVPNGNRIDLNPGVYTAFGIGPGATVSVDDSLGFPVTLNAPYNVFVSGGGDLTISGPGVSFTAGTQQGAVSGAGSSVLVANGASLYSTFGGVGGGASFTLDNATKTDGGFIVGNVGSGTMLVTNSSLWNSTGGLTVGYNYGPGNLTIDDSAVSAVSLVVGAPNLVGAGTVTVRNGGTLALSTGSLVVNRPSWPGYGGANYLVLENGTIQMGAGANPGVLTNFSVMRAAGTIRGGGTSPALVYVGSSGTGTGATLEVGSSIGTLTLVNANLELAAGSQTLLQFSDTGLDQIIINGGSASVLGSNVFSLAAGSALPAPGVKWGLGAYNFVVGDSVTWNPQYDDLTNVLASYGLVQNL